jgi:Holliday junction DNA helicase RuvA
VAFFQRIPGIGKKGAQRIIVDLKGKLPSMKELDLAADEEGEDEVVTALMSFGFSRAEVRAVLKDLGGVLPEAEKIREGLKRLGRGR